MMTNKTISFDDSTMGGSIRKALQIDTGLQYFMELNDLQEKLNCFKETKVSAKEDVVVMGLIVRDETFNVVTEKHDITESIKPLQKFTLDVLKKTGVKIGLDRQENKADYIYCITDMVKNKANSMISKSNARGEMQNKTMYRCQDCRGHQICQGQEGRRCRYFGP